MEVGGERAILEHDIREPAVETMRSEGTLNFFDYETRANALEKLLEEKLNARIIGLLGGARKSLNAIVGRLCRWPGRRERDNRRPQRAFRAQTVAEHRRERSANVGRRTAARHRRGVRHYALDESPFCLVSWQAENA